VAAIGARSGLVAGRARTGQVDGFLAIPAQELNGRHLVTVDAEVVQTFRSARDGRPEGLHYD
jgi:hypothetical protein